MKKRLYIVLGSISVGFAFIGAIVPLLPAFPFVAFSVFCFSKSSERLHQWFLNTKLYQENFDSFVKGEGMTWKAKIKVMASITITMGIGFYFMGRIPVGRIILGVIWLGHMIYFSLGVKTIKILVENS